MIAQLTGIACLDPVHQLSLILLYLRCSVLSAYTLKSNHTVLEVTTYRLLPPLSLLLAFGLSIRKTIKRQVGATSFSLRPSLSVWHK